MVRRQRLMKSFKLGGEHSTRCPSLGSNKGGNSLATCISCDVSAWDDVVALFELAMRAYGAIDVVVSSRPSVLFVRVGLYSCEKASYAELDLNGLSFCQFFHGPNLLTMFGD